MPEIITIGETMTAFTPKSTGFLRYVKDYEMRIAGAESNLAIGVCKLGHTAGWISSLGKDEFGGFTQNSIRAEGVDTSKTVFDSNHRTGIMFKQMQNAGETSVFYYREDSAASHMDASLLDEAYIKTCKILHLTGITPVLSKSCETMIWKVMEIAEKYEIPISFDPNIRRKLWKDIDYTSMLREMMLKARIVLLGLDEAAALLGTTKKEEIIKILFTEGKAIRVAIKDGANGALVAEKNQNRSQDQMWEIPAFPCRCIDPIGAGDAFNAAFLCGILEEKDIHTCGIMGGIAGALATESYGDTEAYPSKERLLGAMTGEKAIYR